MLNPLSALVNLITINFWACRRYHLCCYPQTVFPTFHLSFQSFISRFCLFVQQLDWVWALSSGCTMDSQTKDQSPPVLDSVQAPETLNWSGLLKIITGPRIRASTAKLLPESWENPLAPCYPLHRCDLMSFFLTKKFHVSSKLVV